METMDEKQIILQIRLKGWNSFWCWIFGIRFTVLQNEDVNLKHVQICIYHKLTNSNEFETYEKDAKEMLSDVDYKAATTRKRIRQKVPNEGDTPEVYLNARDNFRNTTFYTIVDKLTTEMKRRGEIYQK